MNMREGTPTSGAAGRHTGRITGRIRGRVAALAAGALLAVVAPAAAHADGSSAPTPAVPTGQGVLQGSGTLCATDPAAPGVVASPQPQLTARVHGATTASQAANLRADFTVDSRNADGSWTRVADQLRPSAGFVTDNTLVTTTLGTTLSTGTVYRLAVATWAYADDQTTYAASAATDFCYFTVDPTGPMAPKIAYGGPYTECGPNDCVAHGGAGVPGTFTFSPADGDSPVVGYEYKFSSDGSWTSVSGSSVTITFTPPVSTFELLQVQARDTLGRYGFTTGTSFKAG